MNPVRRHIPLLARHEGVWEGEYAHIAPDRSLQDQLLFRICVEFPEEGPVAYRQRSHYWWPDGRCTQLAYEGRYTDGRVEFDTGRIRGACWQVDELTIYIRFAFADDPGGLVCEMIQLDPEGVHRARTWHWLRNHELWRITLVRERRLSRDPTEFARIPDRAPQLPWQSA